MTRVGLTFESEAFDRRAIEDPLPAGDETQRRRTRRNGIPLELVPPGCVGDREAKHPESNRQPGGAEHTSCSRGVQSTRHVLHRRDSELQLPLAIAAEAGYERALGQCRA